MGLPICSPDDSTRLGLPIRSLNRRSFCGRFRSRRAIEITGRRGDGEAREREIFRFALPPPVCNTIAITQQSSCSPQRKYFLIRASESENAFSPSRISPPPRLPVGFGGARREALSTAAAPSGTTEAGSLSTWPGDATAASARKRRCGSPRCVARAPAAPFHGF
jgi:hypothetical protein